MIQFQAPTREQVSAPNAEIFDNLKKGLGFVPNLYAVRGFRENRMAVRFEYEWRNEEDQWFRSYGNELWEFAENGLMQKRFTSINDLAILETDRKLR